MSVIVNTQPPAHREPKRDAGSSLFGCIFALGLIIFGLWFGFNKTLEFAHGVLYDSEAVIQAEMEMLHRTMNCEPGEILMIVPLGDSGAKSVKCVPGRNMPQTEPQR